MLRPLTTALLTVSIVCTAFSLGSAHAQNTEIQNFDTEAQRELYYNLVSELRCPKCQNQNIADSNSQIAIDLRNQVARLVRENQNEGQIKQYMVNRYGEFVLYEPPLNKGTFLLWFGPLFMGVLGALVFVMSVLARRKNNPIGDDTAELEESNDEFAEEAEK